MTPQAVVVTPHGSCSRSGHARLDVWMTKCDHVGTRVVEVGIGTEDEPGERLRMLLGPFDDVQCVITWLAPFVTRWMSAG